MNVLIFGATSALAIEVARHYALSGCQLVLVARSPEKLARVSAEFRATYRSSPIEIVADLADLARLPETFARVMAAVPRIDRAVVAQGYRGDLALPQTDPGNIETVIRTNFTSVAVLISLIAAQLERQKAGTLAVMSSIAGERGRAKHFVYGAAKAGLNAYLSGLRQQLDKAGASVVTIVLGPVATPMTAGMTELPLLAQAPPVGRAIFLGIERRRDVLYVPWLWRYIMLVIRNIPECVFKRLEI